VTFAVYKSIYLLTYSPFYFEVEDQGHEVILYTANAPK